MVIVPSTNPFAPQPGTFAELLTDEVDVETTSKVMSIFGRARAFLLIVRATSDTPDTPLTGGEVTLETASDVDFDGLWAPLAVVDVTDIDVSGDDNQGEFQEDDIPFNLGALRARITDAITGGSVTVRVMVSNMC